MEFWSLSNDGAEVVTDIAKQNLQLKVGARVRNEVGFRCTFDRLTRPHNRVGQKHLPDGVQQRYERTKTRWRIADG